MTSCLIFISNRFGAFESPSALKRNENEALRYHVTQLVTRQRVVAVAAVDCGKMEPPAHEFQRSALKSGEVVAGIASHESCVVRRTLQAI